MASRSSSGKAKSSSSRAEYCKVPRTLGPSYVVAITGFLGQERRTVVSALTASGANYTPALDRRNTHLVCKTMSGPKWEKAKERGVEIVGEDWVWERKRQERDNDDDGGGEDAVKYLKELKGSKGLLMGSRSGEFM